MKNKKRKTSLRKKFSLIISGLICITMLSVGLIISNEMKKPLILQMQKKGEALGSNLAATSGEALLSGDELLLGIYMDKIAEDKSILYAMILDKTGKIISHSDHRIIKGTTFKDSFWQKAVELEKGTLIQHNVDPSMEDYYDIAVPILSNGTKLGTIRLGFSGKEIATAIKQVKNLIFAITIFVFILGLILSWIMVSFITKPVGILTKGVQIIGSGNLDHKIIIPTKDEIGQLAETFNQMTEKLKNAQIRLIESERLKKELQIAQQIQQSLLPKKCPQIPAFTVSTFYKAAKEVGGDYYDFFWITPKKLGIVIADVSGKGIPGSLGMALTRSIFRSQITENSQPAEVLAKTNVLVCRDIKKGLFVTMLFAILDTENQTLQYASAGHNPLLFIHKNKPSWTKSSGIALGMADKTLFNQHIKQETLSLDKGSLLIFYTDGITEAMNRKQEEFGETRLEKAALNCKDDNAETIITKIKKEIEIFTAGAEQNDDITIISLKTK
ncbi:SpoIIE family protein phosphatase [bacterium]|nr:SpoIIE family protein phosphatase [bacterium]